MSSFHSDKCTKDELIEFKKQVLEWLNNNFDISGLKIKGFTCYNGDVRIYTGEYVEFQNTKSSFRRSESNKDENGNIIGWNGFRGKHITKFVDYISINRDEFEDIKKKFIEKDDFYQDLIFRKLKVKHNA